MNPLSLPIVQTFIALMVVWALLAMACTFIHETVVQIKSERGKFLNAQLILLLNDKPNGINWGSLMYQHGSFDLLSARVGDPVASISPELFSRSLLHVMCQSSAIQQALRQREEYSMWEGLRLIPTVYKSSDVMEMLKMYIEEAKEMPEADAINHVQKGVESWYGQYEYEMTGRYKQLSKKRLFALGILIALLVNLDSVQVFNYYSAQPTARAAIISYYAHNEELLNDLSDALKSGGDTAFQRLMQQPEYKKAVREGLAQRADIFPFIEPFWFVKKDAFKGDAFPLALLKLIGFLITGFAASLGAPFWFDLLKKAVNRK